MLRARRRRAAFTLIELLVVIAVISILTALAIPAISSVRTKSQVRETTATLERIKLALAHYQNEFGDYPSSNARRAGFPTNGENDGIEVMVRCLTTRLKGGPFIELDDQHLGNADNDRLPSDRDPASSVQTTRDLLEVKDYWGNPVVYIHNAQYDQGGAATLPLGVGRFEARKSQSTGTYLGLTTYQLISAGPDGVAGTEDDIVVVGE
jgi:prepilin-type N-terminal cleavage/methylation domain-containing protein